MMAARLMLAAAALLGGVWADSCPDDPDVDLCEGVAYATSEGTIYKHEITSEKTIPSDGTVYINVNGAVGTRPSLMPILVLAGAFGDKRALSVLPLLGALLAAASGGTGGMTTGTSGAAKEMHKLQGPCGKPDQPLDYVVVPTKVNNLLGLSENKCKEKKPIYGFENTKCVVDGVVQALEQAGANVTTGYQGFAGDSEPITMTYFEAGLCPENVHWHLGGERLSKGEYDEQGVGPESSAEEDKFGEENSRRLAAKAHLGCRRHKYDRNDAKSTTEFYFPDLFRGIIVDGEFGKDIGYYTGSTTGPRKRPALGRST